MPKSHKLKQSQAVIATCQAMNKLGINQGTSGNVSVRHGDRFLITASGISYDNMAADHVVEMDFDGGYWGEFLPSSEWRMHQDIYRARPEAGAVVHTHSTFATALSCLRKDIPAFHYMIAVASGSTIRCADYATFGSEQLSTNMIAALNNRTACLLANHGMICFAPNLEKALGLAVEIENLCRQYVIASGSGDVVILDDEEMAKVLAKFQTYGKQPNELEDGDLPAVEGPEKRG